MKKHVFIKRTLVIALSICAIFLIAASTFNGIWGGYVKDNKLTFNVNYSMILVHIKFEAGSRENPVSYKVISPDNKIVKQGNAQGVVDYLGRGGKGKWTVEFDKNQSEEMRHILWSGNWTGYDSADKNFKSYPSVNSES